jgi:DNA repair protein RadA/Sms
MAVEVQSLVTSAGGDFGRRTVNGIHPSRLQLLLGVLQKRCRVFGFAKCDVYVNIVGQMNLEKGKASDLAIAVTLASSIASIPIRADTAFVGEVGLLGELRTVPSIEKRLQEANRMGFSRVITPLTATNRKGPTTMTSTVHGMEWIQCRTLQAAIDQGLARLFRNLLAVRRSGPPIFRGRAAAKQCIQCPLTMIWFWTKKK